VFVAHDIRIAVRRLVARPAYTALILLTLAIGIGAATAVFSVVDQTILRPAPFAYADRLVDVMHIHTTTKSGGSSLTPQKILGWQGQSALFERFEGLAPQQMDVTGGTEPERLDGLQVSLGLFPMLGVQPKLGRSFRQGDGTPGSERVVIISDALWQRRFGGQADALGQQMLLNDVPHTVVGVMPRRFRLLTEDEAFWLPIDLASYVTGNTARSFYGIGRLAPGVAHSRAQAIADEIADRLQKDTPIAMTWGLGIDKKEVARVDATTKRALLVLLGAVGFVLLITCANVANLFLSQAPAQQREMAIRSALGAGRGQLIQSVLIQSLALAMIGGTLGILLARWGVDAVLAAAPRGMVSMSTTPIEIDARVLLVASAMTLVTGLLFGLLPALRGSRRNLETTLRAAAQSTTRGSYGRVPGGLVVLEVAFAVILLIGAALMARTLANLHAIEPGFEPDGLVAMHVALPSDRYPTLASRVDFFDALAQRVRGIPGIADVAVSQGTPPSIGGISFGKPEIEGHGVPDSSIVVIPNGSVSPGYFNTLGIPLIAGRHFASSEPATSVIVSKAFAEKYWPGGSAVGGRFRMGSNFPWYDVIGVVGNVQARAGRDLPTELQYYRAWVKAATPAAVPAAAAAPTRRSYDYRQIVVRAEDPSAAIPLVKERIWELDKNQPVERIAMVRDTYEEMFGNQRFVLMLMGAFAFVALALTAAGIFGVLSQAVSQRTREIGIRVALGARPADVMRLVVSRGLLLTGIGAGLGVLAAFWLVRTVSALLYQVSPTDPVSFASVALLLFGIALLACWLPTRAAMRVEPALALRVE
jgi:putative ABC transport system permease protein